MQRSNQFNAVQDPCPSEQLWCDFLIGDVEQTTLDHMSDHLSVCSLCMQMVEQLSSNSAKVQFAIKSPYLLEENYFRMVERVAEVRVSDEASDTVVEKSPLGSREVDARIPEMVGRFVVRGVLGSGGFGRVLLADDPLLNRAVAIKLPRRSAFSSERDLTNFLNEARHAAALDHPGIVPIYDLLADDSGSALIVMKYIDGKSLAATLRDRPLGIEKAVRIIIQVARAMHFAHELGFVHRDLKPANILLDKQGKPYISDLGLGLNLDQRDAEVLPGGTPAYMSPEQVKHSPLAIDRRTDIWSMGVMLAELVHGRRPFPQKERADLFRAIRADEPLIESAPETKSLDVVIRRCLTKSPSDRYATADLLADDLTLWLRRNFPTGLEKYRYGWRRNLLAATFCLLLLSFTVITRDQMKRSELRFNLGQLESAPVNQVPKLLARLKANRATVDSISGFGLSSDSAGQFRFDVASLSVGDQSEETIKRCIDAIQTSEPEEIAAVTEALSSCESATQIASEIARRFSDSEFNEAKFRLSAALAGIDPQHSLWKDIVKSAALTLVSRAKNDLPRWLPLFDPVGKSHLAGPLRQLMSDPSQETRVQVSAAHALARFLSNDAGQLATVVGDADSLELRELVEGLSNNRAESTDCLQSLFDEQIALPHTVPIDDDASPTPRDLRAARFAAALWLLKSYEAGKIALRHDPDPTLQTLVIHELAKQDVDPKTIVGLLGALNSKDSRTKAIQFGLLQVLAEIPIDVTRARELNAALRDLLAELQMSPDSGVHSSARLVASRYGVELKRLPIGRNGQWLVDPIGDGVQDFVIIDPCVAEVGIRGGQVAPSGSDSWPLHKRRFPHRIAVATNEVTIEQFRAFDEAYIVDRIARNNILLLESAPDAAMMPLTLAAAYRFCNAWSNHAGYECCYELKLDENGEEKLRPKANHLSLSGYRLATDGEWELACRAGTDTARYFGQVHELVGRYGWTAERTDLVKASNQTALLSQRTSQLLPNRWGIFDMYGNAGELCELGNDPTEAETETIDSVVTQRVPNAFPLNRGVSFLIPGIPYGYSHCRTFRVGGAYDAAWGIRVVRTLLDDDVSGGNSAP